MVTRPKAKIGTPTWGGIPILLVASEIPANSVTNVKKLSIWRSTIENRPHHLPKRL